MEGECDLSTRKNAGVAKRTCKFCNIAPYDRSQPWLKDLTRGHDSQNSFVPGVPDASPDPISGGDGRSRNC